MLIKLFIFLVYSGGGYLEICNSMFLKMRYVNHISLTMMHDLFCVLANSGFLAHLLLLIYFAMVNFSHFPISDKHAHIELMSANESVLF